MLSGKEIVSVISACKKAGVKKFSLENMVIDFEEEKAAQLTPSQSDWIDNLKENLEPYIDEKEEPQRITEDELLPVTDPVAWEESLLTED